MLKELSRLVTKVDHSLFSVNLLDQNLSCSRQHHWIL